MRRAARTAARRRAPPQSGTCSTAATFRGAISSSGDRGAGRTHIMPLFIRIPVPGSTTLEPKMGEQGLGQRDHVAVAVRDAEVCSGSPGAGRVVGCRPSSPADDARRRAGTTRRRGRRLNREFCRPGRIARRAGSARVAQGRTGRESRRGMNERASRYRCWSASTMRARRIQRDLSGRKRRARIVAVADDSAAQSRPRRSRAVRASRSRARVSPESAEPDHRRRSAPSPGRGTWPPGEVHPSGSRGTVRETPPRSRDLQRRIPVDGHSPLGELDRRRDRVTPGTARPEPFERGGVTGDEGRHRDR